MIAMRAATPEDFPALWGMFRPIVEEGETWAMARDMSAEAARDYWFATGHRVYLAELDGAPVGAFFLRPNAGGGGAHVANAGYIVHPDARGRGVARSMGEFSLMEARRLAYRALQFNFVVASNGPALAAWARLGMREVGRIPGGFIHPRLGPVDVLILWRSLDAPG